jgi:ubiquinone/menaquinone biosynthesis C-methylase UbiE
MNHLGGNPMHGLDEHGHDSEKNIDLKHTSPWARERRTVFNDIVEKYDQARWEYPAALYTDIFDYAGQRETKNALEIGAGTGKATVPFLDAGYTVAAVEISKNMTHFLLNKFNGSPAFNVIHTAFEAVALDENQYDIIYAASAFHWVDAAVGCPKVLRLLKNGGTFALFRKNVVPAYGDALFDEVQAVYKEYYYTHYTSDSKPPILSRDDYLTPNELYKNFRLQGLAEYGFADITMKLYDAVRSYNAEQYIALLDTYSDHISLPEENKKALYSGVKKAICKHGGQFNENVVFQLYMGRKPL